MNSYILLRVNNTNYKLDLLGNEKINYNFLISDIKDISKKRTNFSKTISLPGSKNNNDIFNNIFEVTSDSNFNPNKSVSCQLVVDGVPIISGFLKLNKIGFDNLNTVVGYDVIIYGGNFNIANSLGDLKLYELDLSDWNHTINAQTIFNSWSGETPYVYPLVDYGKYFTLDNINMQTPPTDMVEYMDLNPWLKVNSVLYKLFNYAGYSIQSNFLSGEFFNSLIFNTGTKLKYTTDELKNDLFRAELTGTQTADIQNPQQLGGAFYLSSVTISDDYTVGYDYGNNFNTSTGQIIFSGNTRGTGLTTSFEIGLKFKDNSFATNQINYVIRLYLYNNGVPIWDNGQYIMVNANNIVNTWIFTTPEFTVSRTDVLQFRIDASANYPAGALQLEAPSYITNNYGVIDDFMLAGETVRINNFINKEIKAIDFVSSIFKTFNLYVEQSTTDPFTYIIEPRNQFYLGGQIKDWTNKLDSSVEIQQTLLSELQSRKIIFTWKPDTDYLNKNYTEKYDGDIYGQEELTVDNDFLDFKSELKVEPIFTPLFSRIIPGSTKIVTPILYDVDGGQIKFRESVPLKLATHKVINSEEYILGTNRFAPNSGWAESFFKMENYCYAGSIYPSVENPQFNLNFGTPEVTQFLGSAYTQSGLVYPTDNIYTEFWEDTINEITDKNNRLITCSMYLTPADITNLSFRNTIKLKINGNTSYYKLNAIRDYNPLNNEPCKVELIKSENAVPAPKITRRRIRVPEIDYTARINLGNNNQLINPFSLAVGNNNIIESPSSVVFGNSNSSKGLNSIVVGEYNTASTKSLIIGGSGNTTEGKYSAIIAGRNNTIQSRYTTEDNNIIIGGSDNIIRFRNTDNIIIGSTNSEIRTTGITNSVIIGSNNSVLQNDATNAVILGGENILAVSANTTYLQRGVITEFTRAELPSDSARMVTTDKFGYLQPLTLAGNNGIALVNSGGTLTWSYTGSTSSSGSSSGDLYWTSGTTTGDLLRTNSNHQVNAGNTIALNGSYNSGFTANSVLSGAKNLIHGSYFVAYSLLTGIYGLNQIAGAKNTIYGGVNNIHNGFYNLISSTAYSTILNGTNNKIISSQLSIVNGTSNKAYSSSSSIVIGNNCIITTATTAYSNFSSILNSSNSRIQDSNFSTILGGKLNGITGNSHNVILGGDQALIYGSRSSVLNGFNNFIMGGNYSSDNTIVSGQDNLITSGKNNIIFNGSQNTIVNSSGVTLINVSNISTTSANTNTLITNNIRAISLTGSTSSIVKSTTDGLLFSQPEYLFYLTSAFTNSTSAVTNMGWNITMNQGDVYKVDASIIARCSGTGGVRFSVSGNVTPALTVLGHAASTVAAPALRVLLTTGNTNALITMANTDGSIHVHGTISARTNTTVYFGFNSNTNGQTTTVKPGSSLISKRINN